MHRTLATVAMVTALSALSGCAREERWTYDGSHPTPLDDRTPAEMAAAPARPGEPRPRLTDEQAQKKLRLIQEGDVCKVRSTDTALNITATLLVTPGSGNTPTETVRYRQVLVQPVSETIAGKTKDPASGNQWSYRLVSAQFNRVR